MTVDGIDYYITETFGEGLYEIIISSLEWIYKTKSHEKNWFFYLYNKTSISYNIIGHNVICSLKHYLPIFHLSF